MGEQFYLGPYELGPGGENEGIYTGDARVLSEAVPAESVDLIFTDPIYQRIDDYRWLAETAARVLKTDSACLVWHGTVNLPDVLRALLASGLSYHWQIACYMPTLRQFAIPPMFNKWRSCLVMKKGKVRARTCLQDFATDKRSRAQHKWAKTPEVTIYLLDAFCNPDTIVFDPFTGGGTVPAVCKMLGRRYLAFEIDPEAAELARTRVRQAQPPLPGLTLETQAALKLMEDSNG